MDVLPIKAEWNIPALSIGTVHYCFKGCWVFFFFFFQILIEHSKSKQWKPDQMLQNAASGLFLHCLAMSHKKDARLTWVNE